MVIVVIDVIVVLDVIVDIVVIDVIVHGYSGYRCYSAWL